MTDKNTKRYVVQYTYKNSPKESKYAVYRLVSVVHVKDARFYTSMKILGVPVFRCDKKIHDLNYLELDFDMTPQPAPHYTDKFYCDGATLYELSQKTPFKSLKGV